MNKILSTLLLAFMLTSCAPDGKHLFILSGQSNMARLDPNISFSPAVADEFGEDNILVVKDAAGGQPIRRWFKNWHPEGEDIPEGNGDLYDRLMAKVDSVTAESTIRSVTFLWMQGERDAREEHGNVYEASFVGLLDQIRTHLSHPDVNFVIGRLSDFDLEDANYPDWTLIREIQMGIAEESNLGAWIDTDDLNDGLNQNGDTIENDLHMSVEGYRIMGERFAQQAIELIRN